MVVLVGMQQRKHPRRRIRSLVIEKALMMGGDLWAVSRFGLFARKAPTLVRLSNVPVSKAV